MLDIVLVTLEFNEYSLEFLQNLGPQTFASFMKASSMNLKKGYHTASVKLVYVHYYLESCDLWCHIYGRCRTYMYYRTTSKTKTDELLFQNFTSARYHLAYTVLDRATAILRDSRWRHSNPITF